MNNITVGAIGYSSGVHIIGRHGLATIKKKMTVTLDIAKMKFAVMKNDSVMAGVALLNIPLRGDKTHTFDLTVVEDIEGRDYQAIHQELHRIITSRLHRALREGSFVILGEVHEIDTEREVVQLPAYVKMDKAFLDEYYYKLEKYSKMTRHYNSIGNKKDKHGAV